MKSQYSKNQYRLSQRGMFLILLALALIGIMAVLYFVIDVAKMQRTKLLLQRVLDASSLAVTYMFEEQIDGRQLTAEELRTLAQNLVNDNLQAAGLEALPPGPNISLVFSSSPPSGQPRKVVISASVRPNLLLSRLPGMPQEESISAASESGNRRVAIALVLDRSGSMSSRTPFCSDGFGPCTKIEELRRAARAFVTELTPDDRLSMISFADEASVDWPMQKVPSDKAAIFDLIDGPRRTLNAGGWTSTYLGLEQAILQINNPVNNDLMGHDLKALILVTDGAPRGPNADDEQPFPPTPEMVGLDCNLALDSSAQQRRFKRRYIRPLQLADQLRNSGVVVYTVGLGGTPIPAVGATSACPHDLPYSNSHYNPNDPYQCVDFDLHVKSHFLARLSNDQTAMRGNNSVLPVIPRHPDFPTQCVPNKDSLASGPIGYFYQTPRANELQQILVSIAKNIKMRLFK